MANSNLGAAKKAKNDEFYTQYHDIEKEMNAYLDYDPDVFRDKTILLPCDDPEWSNFTKYFAQNFERLGLKQLISTSYAPVSKTAKIDYQPTLFETEDPKFDKSKSQLNGKIFSLTRDSINQGQVNVGNLEWNYLEGDGDFRSSEIGDLRERADMIITNPPFSLFREFVIWALEKGTQCVLIGNMNALTYKEVFPLIKTNKLWLGATGFMTDMVFRVPPGFAVSDSDREKAAKLGYVGDYTRLGNAAWFTTLDHGRRHQPLSLMTTAENIRFSKHKELQTDGYRKYDNYDAVEVSWVDAIPSDCEEVMGVPISFLGKYSPDQFTILGASDNGAVDDSIKIPHFKRHNEPFIDGKKTYKRIFIKHRKSEE